MKKKKKMWKLQKMDLLFSHVWENNRSIFFVVSIFFSELASDPPTQFRVILGFLELFYICKTPYKHLKSWNHRSKAIS